MTTVSIENQLYRIVPDKERADSTRSPCDQCAFNSDGVCTDVDDALDCLTGVHYYVLIEDGEQA